MKATVRMRAADGSCIDRTVRFRDWTDMLTAIEGRGDAQRELGQVRWNEFHEQPMEWVSLAFGEVDGTPAICGPSDFGFGVFVIERTSTIHVQTTEHVRHLTLGAAVDAIQSVVEDDDHLVAGVVIVSPTGNEANATFDRAAWERYETVVLGK